MSEAVEFIRTTLGIEPTVEALFERLGRDLGGDEVERLRILATQYGRISPLASVVVALDRLGVDWWNRPRIGSEVTRTKEDGASPAKLIQGDETLDALWIWAVEDVADDEWPPAVGFVDAYIRRHVLEAPAPPNTNPGDEVTISWDAGCRVLAVVVERDGRLGIDTRSELLYSVAVDAEENWRIATS
ncbi:hypothetical protein [Kutzneria sp. 744]|uniref:hypothetical protein n=1 Tax=Kutzneria sp. (strain 744) TaxID=345341 RepID=UPI0003EEE0A4|nr:hypothetical protein [Kutzneria sp. 744]EWM11680.1 hypothetical protein KUTG_01984 [Kutzneria sp. 744]